MNKTLYFKTNYFNNLNPKVIADDKKFLAAVKLEQSYEYNCST